MNSKIQVTCISPFSWFRENKTLIAGKKNLIFIFLGGLFTFSDAKQNNPRVPKMLDRALTMIVQYRCPK